MINSNRNNSGSEQYNNKNNKKLTNKFRKKSAAIFPPLQDTY